MFCCATNLPVNISLGDHEEIIVNSNMRSRLVLALIMLLPALVRADSFLNRLVKAAIERTKHEVRYDGSYFVISYPDGDVPNDRGVCTDVVIRAYRALGVDLQQLVHEDMQHHFDAYPSKRIWGLTEPDPNIDHRRVPNLQLFFKRNGIELRPSEDPSDYKPGDIVTWMLPGNLPHIGIVTDRKADGSGTPLVVHNIGEGPKLEDVLFYFKITGHYRYEPKR